MSTGDHRIQLTHTTHGYTTCICYIAGERHHLWEAARLGDSDVTVALGVPVRAPDDVLADLAAHFTSSHPGHPPPTTEAGLLTALARNIAPGVALLVEHLPDLTLTVHDNRKDAPT